MSVEQWLRCPRLRPDAEFRLICFPHAGGSAPFFQPWHRTMDPRIEVRAVQYPGRADRLAEPLVGDARTLAGRIADVLSELDDRPLALFGHSMGALVAYETARALGPEGTKHLFVSGANAAHVRESPGSLLHPDDDVLVANLATLGGTDAAVLADPEMREIALPAVRNDLSLVDNYEHVPGAPLDCPITALIGRDDNRVTADGARSWGELTGGDFAMRQYSGDHFFLLRHSRDVLDELARRLGCAPAACR